MLYFEATVNDILSIYLLLLIYKQNVYYFLVSMHNKWFYNDTFIHICYFTLLILIPFLFSPIPTYLLFISVFSELFLF